MKTRNSILSVLVLTGLLVMPALAQDKTGTPDFWASAIQADWTLAEITSPGSLPAGVAAADFDAMTARDWKKLRKQLVRDLQSGTGKTWEDAVRSVIHLSLCYHDKADFSAASMPLLETYILERSEQHRILALVAMLLIGNDNTMAELGLRVNTEGSPRVRMLTMAALADHYGYADYYGRHGRVEIGIPVRIADR